MARLGSASPSGARAGLAKTRASAMRASCVALVALILLLGPGEVDADDLVRYKCKELAILDVDQGTCACVENATLAPGNTSTCACDKGSYFEDALAACTGCPAGYYKNEIGNDESLCAPCPWPSSVSEDASTCVCPEDKGLIFEDEQMNCTCVRDVHVQTVESVIRLPYLYEIGENVSSTKPIVLGNLFTISSGAGESSNATVTVNIIDGANKVNKTVELTQDDELAVPVSTENATLEIVAEPGCLWRDDAIVSVAVVPLGFSLTSIVENHTLFVEWTLYSTEWPVLHVYLERAPGLLDEIGSSRNGRIAWPIPSSGIGLDHDSTEADAKPIPRSIWLSVSQGAEVDPVAWSLEKAASTVTDIQYLRFVATTAWTPCDCSLDLPKETRKVECQRLSDAATLTYTAVPNAFCERAGLSEPDAERLCFACPQALSASWALDNTWSACSASACGTTGVRSREARCWNASGEVTQDPTSVCGELASLDLEQNCSLLCEPVVLSSQIDSCTFERCVDKWSGRALASSECQSLQASLGAENCETWSLCNQTCGVGETLSSQGESRACNVRRCDPVVALYSPEGATVCVSGDFYDVPCNESDAVVSCDSFCGSSSREESESDDLAGRRRRLSMTYLPESVISDELERRCPNSDVMTPGGSCCPFGNVLDRSGACCSSGFVDACGVCGGNGTLVDLSGKCCSEIDAEGFCCESGTDVLGVCAGTAVLHNASAECGNGICEVGEACDNINDDCCADDCPFPVTYCTPEYGIGWSEVRPCGGLGKCLLAQGVCDCYSGAGRSSFDPFESCVGASSCAADHTWTAKGCIQDTALTMMLCTNGQLDEGESGVDCGGFCPFSCDGTLSPTLPTPEPTSALQSAAGQIAPRVWIPIVSSLGALLMCACGVFAAVQFHNERLRKKLQAIKRKVDPDAHPVHGPSVAQREHESLPTKWSGRKSLTVPLDVAYRTFGATEEHPEGAASIDARLAELQRREELLSKEIVMEGWIETMKGDIKQKRQVHRLQRKDGDDADDDESCADLTTDEEDHVAQHQEQQQQRLRKDKANTKKTKWARRRVGKTKQQANSKRAKRAVYGVLKPVGELLLYRDMVASGFGKIHMDYIETVNLRSMTHVKLDGHTFCVEERPRKDLPPLRSLRFAAANQTEAKEWVDTLLCLVHMFEDQRRPPESAISDSQEFFENVRDDGDETSESDVADEAEVTLTVRHVRSESQVDQTLAPPRTPAPSAPIPPTLPDKGSRYRSSSSPQRVRSRSQRRDRSKSRQKRGRAASAQASAVTRRVVRGRGSSVPPPLPPWPGDAVVDAERPKRTMSTGDLRSYRPQRTIREARAAGVSEYEMNNDIWAEFQKSFAS